MASFNLAHIKAFALDPKNQGFLNKFYGQPKEMKCFLCKEVSVSHGNNAQPFCKESRQELVCDDCNKLVLSTRQFIARQGGHPYEMTAPQHALDEARRVCKIRTRPAEKSAPTRKPEQTKSQSKRAM